MGGCRISSSRVWNNGCEFKRFKGLRLQPWSKADKRPLCQGTLTWCKPECASEVHKATPVRPLHCKKEWNKILKKELTNFNVIKTGQPGNRNLRGFWWGANSAHLAPSSASIFISKFLVLSCTLPAGLWTSVSTSVFRILPNKLNNKPRMVLLGHWAQGDSGNTFKNRPGKLV